MRQALVCPRVEPLIENNADLLIEHNICIEAKHFLYVKGSNIRQKTKNLFLNIQ